MKDKNILGIDIGSSKITAAIGTLKSNKTIEVRGIGTHVSKGIRKGVVVNLRETVNSIKSAVEAAELMSGDSEENAIIGIAGGHIKSFNCHGSITIDNPQKEITEEDIQKVHDIALVYSLPCDREKLEDIPRIYYVDGEAGTAMPPIGMRGSKLAVDIHVITGAISSAKNIYRSVEKSGYYIQNVVLNPMASSEVLLTDDEKQLGVMMLDIGDSSIDIAVFVAGSIWYSNVIMLGGFNITRDIAVCLRIPFKEASKIKCKYGDLMFNMDDDKMISVDTISGNEKKEIKLSELNAIISARVREIFEIVKFELTKNNIGNYLNGGVVLSGGTSQIKNISEFAANILDLPVKVGTPNSKIVGRPEIIKKPENSAVLGLLLFENEKQNNYSGISETHLFRKIKQFLTKAVKKI